MFLEIAIMKRQVEVAANQLNNASIIENVLSLQKMAKGSRGTQCRKVRIFLSFDKNFVKTIQSVI